MDQAVAFVRQFATTGTTPSVNNLPDRFGSEVRQKFYEMVVNPEALRATVSRAVSSYEERLRDIDARTVVALHADLPDEALAGGPTAPVDATPVLSDLEGAFAMAMQA